MASVLGLVSLSLSFLLSTVTAASPESLGSDLSIVTHNDLYGNSSRRAATVVFSTPYKYSTATSRCAALGSVLWNPDSYNQSFDFLRYLDHGKPKDDVGVYWIKGNNTVHCRAMNTRGEFTTPHCSTELPSLCSNTATDTERLITVNTGNAAITGYRDRRVFRFLGLRYTAMPARFAHSTYLPPTSNITAMEYSPWCLQPDCTNCSEDCLTLNIWTPYLPNGKVASEKKKAVFVWIHGGGYTTGSGNDPDFDGTAQASRGDVVAVTINYRLSTFGFLALDGTPLTGNYGLQDMNTAIDWLRAHVEDFGGDKDRITIFGQSAGASAVRALLASPQVNNKVTGAIMMSTPHGGRPGAPRFADYPTIAEATTQMGSILNQTGCTSKDEVLSCLRKVDPTQLVGKIQGFPVLDGTFLKVSSLPLGPDAPKLDVSILSGIIHDDGAPFTSYPKSNNVSQVITDAGFNASAIINSSLFPIPENTNTTLALFNLTSRIGTDGRFRCLGQSTAYVAAKNHVFKSVYAYETDRAYQIIWSPNAPACEAPITPSHPFGDPNLPYYKCHSGDLYLVFGTSVFRGRPIRDDMDIPFSQFMVDTWTSFARTGNPTPDAAFLEARGFSNTTMFVEKGGPWAKVGESDTPLRVLDTVVRSEAWREVKQCEVLEQPLGYYDRNV